MRMSPHVNTHHRHDVVADYIRRVGSGVKLLDTGWDTELVRVAKAAGGLVVGRLYESNQELGAGGGRWIQRNLAWAREHPEMDYVEGFNEEFQGGEEMSRYAELELERMRAFDAAGLKARCIIGCFSCGNPPNFDDWERFLPALRYAVAHGHVLGLHEYSGPIMQWMAGANQWNHQAGAPYRLDDPCTTPGVDGFLTLRHRKVQRLLRERWGLTGVKLAFTETGIDDVQPRPGPQGKGYKSYLGTEWERTIHGDYAQQLRWYGARLSEDPDVVFWCDFGFGQAGDWETFDLSNDDAMRERVIAGQLTAPQSGAPAPGGKPMLAGIDVSHWQGAIDWRKAFAAGVRFAWIKAAQGASMIDPRYHENARGAEAAGVLWGPYHYWEAGVSGQAQARHLAAVVAAGPAPSLCPACDLEDKDPAPLITDVRLYVDSVKASFGGRAVIYTARWWWDNYLRGAASGRDWARGYPLWVASYTHKPTTPPTSMPSAWSDWAVHQYTNALDGPRFGMSSAKLDGNVWRGTVEELKAALGSSGAPVDPALDVDDLVRQVTARHQAAGIRLNPNAALQRAMRADGLVPTLNEEDYNVGGQVVTATRGESLAGGGATVYWWDARAGKASKRGVP